MADQTPLEPGKELDNGATSQNSTVSPPPGGLPSLVSRYPTSIGIHTLLDLSVDDISVSDAPSNPPQNALSGSGASQNIGNLSLPSKKDQLGLAGPHESVEKHVANFQRSFASSFETQDTTRANNKVGSGKQSKFSRASISSLINSDESVPSVDNTSTATTQAEKRKRITPKIELAAKKPKVDTQKKLVKAALKEEAAQPKADTKETKMEATKDAFKDTAKDSAKRAPKSEKTETKAEAKKTAKAKKKTPDIVLPSQEKPSIHPTMTTEKAKPTASPANIPGPSFIAMEDMGLGDAGNGRSLDEQEKLPVIALDIPLLDPKQPKPGQAGVIVNVLKLAEEKYGWSAVHPEARSAFEMMEDVLDDDDEGDEEEDEEVMIVDENGNALKKKDEGGDKKKRKQLQQTKVNRKVGKYDFEDPFIDDDELQWEEEITTTKEGFFVYWGPLVDERQSSKKASAKGKK